MDAAPHVTKPDPDEGTTGERTASTIDTPWPEQGLPQQVAISSVRERLFGTAAAVRFGRYRLERRLGAGGMGEVYLATDSNLGRRVALKRVRADANSWALRERLQREARALARLNHPNVVQVFEVDEWEGETYLAMEYVEGQTLGGWLRQPHAWREILAKFLAAGHGLAAAHSADVVHRDFKPDNVLIGDDGRVRVADFGLALRTESTVESQPSVAARLEPRMTGAGGFVGTLRYMPLEQLTDQGVDARSDQFAFCVALYEALYGHEPFALGKLAQRIDALERDAATVPRGGAPPAIWKVLRRGLRRDPDARWPDMDSLLHALARASRRRQLIAGGLAATLMIAGATWLLWPEPDRCAGIEHELDGVWDDSRKTAVREAFEASGLAYAATSFTQLDAALGRWATGWIEQRRSFCIANTDADESDLEWAQRSCLDRQRHAVDVLVTELSQIEDGEADAIEHVVDVLLEIPDPLDCGVERTLEQPVIEPEARERVAQLRLQLAELKQLRLLGRADIERTNGVLEAARALGQAPVLAEATADLAKSQIEAGSPVQGVALLEQAADLALRSDHERLLAETWLDLATRVVNSDVALGERYCELAGAQWSKLDPDARTRSLLEFCRARVLLERGDRARARASIETALALLDGPDAARPAYLQTLARLSEPANALGWRREALEAAEQAWGAEHPHTAVYLYELGSALLEHDVAAARPLLERAIQIWTTAHTEPHPDLAWAHLGLANLALTAVADASSEPERNALLDTAERHARACAEIQARTLAPDDPSRGNPFNVLSHVAGMRGDSRAALVHSLVALEHYERAGEGEFVQLLRYEVGANLLAAGQLERGRMQFEQLLASTSELARTLGELGLAELALRRDDPTACLAALDRIDLSRLGVERVLIRAMRALAQLRTACADCRASAQQLVRELEADPDLGVYDLGLWFDGFALTDAEREVLAPLL
jgi:predicted Ser/Thr protein kinase/tetratricopeptide (TPR) repeat protein